MNNVLISICSNSRSSFYDLYLSSDEEDLAEDDKDLIDHDDPDGEDNGSRADDSIIEDTSSHDIWQGKKKKKA